MLPILAGDAERDSLRSRYLASRAAPQGLSGLVAAAAIAAVLTELVLAQLTLAIFFALLLVGRASRWRPLWLAWPAGIGLACVLSAGLRPALAGYAAAGGEVLRFLTASGPLVPRLAQLSAEAGRIRQLVPAQFAIALIAGSAQALAVHALGWREYRPGVLAAARRAYVTATMRRGEVATEDGGCVGAEHATGGRLVVTWKEARAGVLCAGPDALDVTATGLELVLAAIAHRKGVIVAPAGNAPDGLAASIAEACAAAGAPLRTDVPPDDVPEIERVLAGRGVVLLGAGRHAVRGFAPDNRHERRDGSAGRDGGRQAGAAIACQAADTLTAVLAGYARSGGTIDCLAWISGCAGADPRQLADLVALGPPTGAAIVLGTANDKTAAGLAAGVGVVVVRGAAKGELASALGIEPAGDPEAICVRRRGRGGRPVLVRGRAVR